MFAYKKIKKIKFERNSEGQKFNEGEMECERDISNPEKVGKGAKSFAKLCHTRGVKKISTLI